MNENMLSSINQPLYTVDEDVLRHNILTHGLSCFNGFSSLNEEENDIKVDDFFTMTKKTKEDEFTSTRRQQDFSKTTPDVNFLQDLSRKSTTDTACCTNGNDPSPVEAKLSKPGKEVATRKHSFNPFKVIKPLTENYASLKDKDDLTENTISEDSILKSQGVTKTHEFVKYKNRLAAKKHRVKKASYYKTLEEENRLMKKMLQGTYGSDLNKIVKSKISTLIPDSFAKEDLSLTCPSLSTKKLRSPQNKKYQSSDVLDLKENLHTVVSSQAGNDLRKVKERANERTKQTKFAQSYSNNNESTQVVLLDTPYLERLPEKKTSYYNMNIKHEQEAPNGLGNTINQFSLNDLEYKDFNEDSSFNNIEVLDLGKFNDSLEDSSEISFLGNKRNLRKENERDVHSLLENLNMPINLEEIEGFGNFNEKATTVGFNVDKLSYLNNSHTNINGFPVNSNLNSCLQGISQFSQINNISICPSFADSCLMRQNCCCSKLRKSCCQKTHKQSFSRNCDHAKSCNMKDTGSRAKKENTPVSKRKKTEGSLDSLSSYEFGNKCPNTTEKKKMKLEGKIVQKASEMKRKAHKESSVLKERFSSIPDDKVFSCLLEAKKEAITAFLSNEISFSPDFLLTEKTTQDSSQRTSLVNQLNNCLVKNFLKRISSCSV